MERPFCFIEFFLSRAPVLLLNFSCVAHCTGNNSIEHCDAALPVFSIGFYYKVLLGTKYNYTQASDP